VTISPESASGATYISVPTKKPARVSRSSAFWSAAAAMPKSSSFTSPLAGSYITFSGFRSRCTIPASCAGLHRAGDLRDDLPDLGDRQRAVALGVLLEDLAPRPLDGEEVQPRLALGQRRLADLDGAHHVRVDDAPAVARLAHEARHGRAVVAQLLLEHLQRDGPVRRVVGAVHRGGAALAHEVADLVAGDRTADERFTGHEGDSTGHG
jgi:hypothetical protein